MALTDEQYDELRSACIEFLAVNARRRKTIQYADGPNASKKIAHLIQETDTVIRWIRRLVQ